MFEPLAQGMALEIGGYRAVVGEQARYHCPDIYVNETTILCHQHDKALQLCFQNTDGEVS